MSYADTPAEPLAREATIARLVDDVDGLVSPPDVCLRLFELIHSPRSGAKEIAEVVAVDPGLTARLLRMANSAFYGFSRKIDTVSRAVTVIGNGELYSLVLSISAVKSFTSIPNDLVSMETFWRHSVYTGLLARALAQRVRVLHPERLFVAGLLHDIGSLVLYHERPDIMRDLLLVADGDEEVLYRAEQEELGFTHATLAGYLMEKWLLPTELQQAVLWHHEPHEARTARMEAHLLYVAGLLVNESDQGNFAGSPRADIRVPAQVLEELGIDEDELFFAFEEAAEQFPSTLRALL